MLNVQRPTFNVERSMLSLCPVSKRREPHRLRMPLRLAKLLLRRTSVRCQPYSGRRGLRIEDRASRIVDCESPVEASIDPLSSILDPRFSATSSIFSQFEMTALPTITPIGRSFRISILASSVIHGCGSSPASPDRATKPPAPIPPLADTPAKTTSPPPTACWHKYRTAPR